MKNYSKLLLSAFAILPLVLSSFVARNASSESYKMIPHYFHNPITKAKGTNESTFFSEGVMQGKCANIVTQYNVENSIAQTYESKILISKKSIYNSYSKIEDVINKYS